MGWSVAGFPVSFILFVSRRLGSRDHPSSLFNRACNGALCRTCVVWLAAFHSKKRLYRVFTTELTFWRLFNRSNDD